jgi:predicted PurR-regulated permease PerM
MTWSAKLALAALAGLLVLLYFLGPVLMPFVLSAGLAYLADPLVDRLQRRMSRTLAVTLVFVTLSAVFLPLLMLLLPLLIDQVREFITHVPDYLAWIQQTGLPAIGVHLPPEMQLDAENIKRVVAENLPEAGGLARDLFGTLSRSGGAFLLFMANLLLIPVVTFYLLRDWDTLIAWVDGALPPRYRDTVRVLAQESDFVLSGFLRGQLLVMLSLGAIYSLGLWIVGVKLALLIGIGAGLVSFVPYLGFIAGLLAASIAVLAQMNGLTPLLGVLAVFMIGQAVESMLLTPWLVGDRIGLHPVAVIFAVMAGGQLFGFLGMLLALPVAAVANVLIRHAHERYTASRFYLGHGASGPKIEIADTHHVRPTPDDPSDPAGPV